MSYQKPFDVVISLLVQFLNGDPTIFPRKIRKHSKVLHYYREVIRFWNKINFILSYTISALDLNRRLNEEEKALYSLIIYLKEWENTSIRNIINKFEELLKISKYQITKEQIAQFYSKLNTFSWKKAYRNKSKLERQSIGKAVPSFFLKKLFPYMSEDFLMRNIDQMNEYQEMDTGILLINNKKSIEKLKEEFTQYLLENEVSFEDNSQIRWLINIRTKNLSTILKSTFYKEGELLILDKGSAYITNLLLGNRNGKILDMCAAPGIKTIQLVNSLRNTHKVIAIDFSSDRVYEMQRLLDFYNISNISILNADSIDLPIREGVYFDKIFLDAPCTGSGTFSSNPELKWRQNPSFLHQNTILQQKLLVSAIKMLKPQGTLVYSTCSMYAQEGELQIEKVLDKLEPYELPEVFESPYKVNGKTLAGTGRLFPAVHNSKGFFVGKFKKI